MSMNHWKIICVSQSFSHFKHSEDSKSIVQGREIGRVFAEYKDKLIIIDGENRSN